MPKVPSTKDYPVEIDGTTYYVNACFSGEPTIYELVNCPVPAAVNTMRRIDGGNRQPLPTEPGLILISARKDGDPPNRPMGMCDINEYAVWREVEDREGSLHIPLFEQNIQISNHLFSVLGVYRITHFSEVRRQNRMRHLSSGVSDMQLFQFNAGEVLIVGRLPGQRLKFDSVTREEDQ